MKVEPLDLTIEQLVDDYFDDEDGGVVGYSGNLDIRPPYQREFVYKEKERNAVIHTVLDGFPLNSMYWADKEDGTFEIIDGQQRTISICQYVEGDFYVEYRNDKLGFDNLPEDIQQEFLNYELMIFVCTGPKSEKLDWFRTINTGGLKLKEQELRNAVYSGSWVSSAKRYFSKRNEGAGSSRYSKYLDGDISRQAYLQTVIKWISGDKIEEYMLSHQREPGALHLWEYFESVIAWVESIFPNYNSVMKKVDWGLLYNEYRDKTFDVDDINSEVEDLLHDKDVREAGIYDFVITRDRKHIHKRAFDNRIKRIVYRKQEGVCPNCRDYFEFGQMEADHIEPWSEGGKTIEENCQMLCRTCNREKSSK